MFLWCVQKIAKLKEEDIISHTATATQLPTAAAGVSGSLSRTLSELHHSMRGPILYTLALVYSFVFAIENNYDYCMHVQCVFKGFKICY